MRKETRVRLSAHWGKKAKLVLIIGAFICIGVLGVLPAQPAAAACFGNSCHGLDPQAQGCAMSAWDGARTPVNPDLDVVVRKSVFCGGVKWPRASRGSFLNNRTFKVWLEDTNGHVLPGTEYSLYSGWDIYGNMWNGAVRACASIQGYLNGQARCTPVDY